MKADESSAIEQSMERLNGHLQAGDEAGSLRILTRKRQAGTTAICSSAFDCCQAHPTALARHTGECGKTERAGSTPPGLARSVQWKSENWSEPNVGLWRRPAEPMQPHSFMLVGLSH